MSTCYSAIVMFAYALPKEELNRSKPNPLWGKHKFDPETGDKVVQFIEDEIELALEEGDNLRTLTDFTRRDTEDTILLGVELGDTGDINYADREPQALKLVSDANRAKVEAEARKLLDKAGVTFDPDCMGYWLTANVF